MKTTILFTSLLTVSCGTGPSQPDELILQASLLAISLNADSTQTLIYAVHPNTDQVRWLKYYKNTVTNDYFTLSPAHFDGPCPSQFTITLPLPYAYAPQHLINIRIRHSP